MENSMEKELMLHAMDMKNTGSGPKGRGLDGSKID